jgi:hypothetical protein
MIMKTTTTLILAGRLFMALGVGTAIAQSEISAGAGNFIDGHQAAPMIIKSQDQAGSSDADAVRSGAHVLPFNGDYGNLANPG